MIPLDKVPWLDLQHAYGNASDIPNYLLELECYPAEGQYQEGPFYHLWSALCHQGDTYDGSYVALPYIVKILNANPQKATQSYYLLPTCIEISRSRGMGEQVPDWIQHDYLQAIATLGACAERELTNTSDSIRIRYLKAAILVSRGKIDDADTLLNEE